MRIAPLLLVFTFASGALAQDEKTAAPPKQDVAVLKNGDRITGSLKTAADGKITFHSAALGDVTIPIAELADLKTAGAVELLTQTGELVKRRITGVSDGQLTFASGGEGAPDVPSLALGTLDKINPPEKPPVKWTGSLSVGGFIATGNTERRSVTSKVDLERRSESDRITANVRWNYAQEKNNPGRWSLTERRTTGALKYDYFLGEKSYVYAATSATGDTRANIDLRYTAGGGLGWQWIETDKAALLTELGLSYFVENYRDTTPEQDNLAARAAVKGHYVVIDGIKLFDDLEMFPSLEDGDDFYLNNSLYTRVTLTEAMFAEPRWEVDYDNTPSPGQDRVDHRFFLSVGWSF